MLYTITYFNVLNNNKKITFLINILFYNYIFLF